MITLSRYEAGEVIVQENDFGETAYVIAQGQVEVSKELDGQNVHLAYLGAGETFGEMSMIDEKPRSATVTAVTETLVSEVQRDDFFNSFQTDPKVALASGTAHYYARRGNPASCRRSTGNSFSDHTIPLSYWQTESRSACL